MLYMRVTQSAKRIYKWERSEKNLTEDVASESGFEGWIEFPKR